MLQIPVTEIAVSKEPVFLDANVKAVTIDTPLLR